MQAFSSLLAVPGIHCSKMYVKKHALLPDCNLLIISKHRKPTFSIRFSEDRTTTMPYNLRTLAALPINIKREGEERRGRRIHSVPGQAPGPCGRPHCHCQSSEHEPWNGTKWGWHAYMEVEFNKRWLTGGMEVAGVDRVVDDAYT